MKMGKSAKLFGLSLIALHGFAAPADKLKLECPESIEATESIKVEKNSWRVAQDLGKRGKFLDSVVIYDGPPENMASLVPDKTTQKNRKRRFVWYFNEQSASQYWVACTYTNSSLLLAKPLPASIHKCELSESLLGTGVKLAIEEITCE